MDIIKVLMTKSEKGSPDGLKVRKYEKGKEYDLPESLASVFINDLEVAELAKEPEAELSEEEKAEAKKAKAAEVKAAKAAAKKAEAEA